MSVPMRSLVAAAVVALTLGASACTSQTQSATPAPPSLQPIAPTPAPAATATQTPPPAPRSERSPMVPRSTHEAVKLSGFNPVASNDSKAATAPVSASTSAGSTSQARRSNPAPAGSVDCAVAKCVALTFDDGPGPHTARLLGMLTREGVSATFFMQGVNVQANPALARQVAATSGMEIGGHSATHPQLTTVGSERLRREIVGNHATIKQVTGETPTVFRPPYGARNASVDAMAAQAGEAVILWDVDTLDWMTRSPSATRRAIANETKPGSIVLMHDIHGSTVDAVPSVITDLKSDGYTLVTVSELFGGTTPGRVYSRR